MRFSTTTRPPRDESIAGRDSIGSRARRLIVPGILALSAFVVLVSLGDWQLRRLAWKQDLVSRVAERPASAPVDMRNDDLAEIGEPASFLEQNEYRPMILRGEYRPAGEVLVFTSLDQPVGRFGGPGYWVMTPFVTPPSGATILINRGFVPEEKQATYASPPAGEQTIRGLIRAPETGSWLTPKPDVAKRLFFSRNPAAIASATGLAEELHVPGRSSFINFFIDLDPSGTPSSELPQAGETRMAFPNNHLQYAITWYGLSAALLAVFSVFAWQTLRRSGDKGA